MTVDRMALRKCGAALIFTLCLATAIFGQSTTAADVPLIHIHNFLPRSAQAFDATNVQIVCAFQLNQFIATRDIAAIEAAIRDMPCIVFAAMQSDCESLFLQFSHDFIVFRAFCSHNQSMAVSEQTFCAQLHTCYRRSPPPPRDPPPPLGCCFCCICWICCVCLCCNCCVCCWCCCSTCCVLP